MKRNKDTVSELSIQKRQELIQNKKIQILGLIIVICCIGYSLALSKGELLSSILVNHGLISSTDKKNVPMNPEELLPNEDQEEPEVETDTNDDLTLYALSACLMDASNGRVLYDKDAYKEMPMASTTKIMTLLVTLENANLDDIVTVTANAAKQPDVQLNIKPGEKYVLRDLLYSLMLESHNDAAVAIAEHVGGSVEAFCDMMTAKAVEIGANNTSFKTPNGLDEVGHYTTARDLSLIASYAIRNKDFCRIVKTQTYQFNEVSGKRSFSVNNRDRFLYMMEGAIGIKTGYTGKAGYCFVGAIKIDGKTFVSTVLGSGWPPHKEYKWSDTKKLMKYGLTSFEFDYLFDHMQQDAIVHLPDKIAVLNGKANEVAVTLQEDISQEKMLLSGSEKVSTSLMLNDYIEAPIGAATIVGTMNYYINNNLYRSIPIITKEEVDEVDFGFFFQKVLDVFL
jgi:D-alanyl-D-alanine carboxypeptidase (penicillin-binding protein 5/6)